MKSSRKRGWVIIALDLMIVLGIYVLYLNLGTTPVPRTELRAEAHYTLQYEAASEDPSRLIFSVNNPSDTNLTVPLPEGITLQISDGRNTVYWREKILEEKSLQLKPREQRSWKVEVNPPRVNQPLYADFYIDSDRQGRIELP